MPHTNDDRLFEYLTALESMRDGIDPHASAAEFADVTEHLSGCPACEERLHEIMAGIAAMHASLRLSFARGCVHQTHDLPPAAVIAPRSERCGATMTTAETRTSPTRPPYVTLAIGTIPNGQQRISGLIHLRDQQGALPVSCKEQGSSPCRSRPMLGVGMSLVVLAGAGIVATRITFQSCPLPPSAVTSGFAQTTEGATSEPTRSAFPTLASTANEAQRAQPAAANPPAIASIRPDETSMHDGGGGPSGRFASEVDRRLFGSIAFLPGSTTLSPNSRQHVAQLAQALLDSSGTVTIEGYSSSVPVRRSLFRDNNQLSQARADAVKLALVGSGVPEYRIVSNGMGEVRQGEPASHCMRADIFIAGQSPEDRRTISDASADDLSQ